MPHPMLPLLNAYARAFERHEESCLELGHATALHEGPRKRHDAKHRDALERARAEYRETSCALRAARGAILDMLETEARKA